MPPLPAAPKVVSLAVKGSIYGQVPWLSRVYLHYAGTAPTNADLATFLTACDTAWNTNMKPMQDAFTTVTEFDATDLSSSTSAVATKAVNRIGTRAGSALPADVCAVIAYEIARRYRGGHPRGYWRIGTVTDEGEPRHWDVASVPVFKAAFDAWMTALLAAGWSGAGTLTQVNVSYFNGFTVVTSPTTGRARNVPTLRGAPVVDTVTSTICRHSYGTQRRRLQFNS